MLHRCPRALYERKSLYVTGSTDKGDAICLPRKTAGAFRHKQYYLHYIITIWTSHDLSYSIFSYIPKWFEQLQESFSRLYSSYLIGS